LCDCCSTRNKLRMETNATAIAILQSTQSEYEFNHATHYKYNATTPRMGWREVYDS
jgi:hypothetical protein